MNWRPAYWYARWRCAAIRRELAAVRRQRDQLQGYQCDLLRQEARASIALLLAEGGDVSDALHMGAVMDLKGKATK